MELLILTTTKELELVLAGSVSAVQPTWTSHYADSDGTAIVEGSSEGEFNGTTPVVAVAAPASGRRVVKNITVYNADNAAIGFTLRLDDGMTTRGVKSVTLQPGKGWDFSSTDASVEVGPQGATGPSMTAYFPAGWL